MRFICQAVPKRSATVERIRKDIPNLEVHYDRFRDPVGAFVETLRMSQNERHIHLEDDIVLCSDFVAKVKTAALKYPRTIISFFVHPRLSRSFYNGKRPTIFPPRSFCATVAFHVPPGVAYGIIESVRRSQSQWEDPLWFGMGVVDWLERSGSWPIIWYPSLVQHMNGRSMVGHDRRIQSAHFVP